MLVPAIPIPRLSPEPAPTGSHVIEPPRIETIEELDALLAQPPEVPRAADRKQQPAPQAVPYDRAVSRHLERLAETMVEELGALGMQRRQLDGQTWTGKGRTERRLLARVDGILACGPHVLPRLVRKLETRPVPDAELTWGLLFLFGSIAGDDALDEAIRVARASALETPEVLEAVADAFALVPNVRIEGRLRTWLSAAREAERAVAVHALGRRGAITADEVRAVLASPALPVVREAALAIRSASGRVDPQTMDWLLHHDDERVVQRALVSAVLRHDASGVRRARTLIRAHQAELGDAALVFALSEGRDALDALFEAAAVSGAPSVLVALGWFGHLGAVPYLIGRLESDDDMTRESAAAALVRIAGSPHAEESFPSDEPVLRSESCLNPKLWRRWWRRHERHGTRGFATGSERHGKHGRIWQSWNMTHRRHRRACWRTSSSSPASASPHLSTQMGSSRASGSSSR